jgi:hypothetical protein
VLALTDDEAIARELAWCCLVDGANIVRVVIDGDFVVYRRDADAA